ncbi:hypothetical protein EB796_025088 [Bugula neritina]|uniref:malate synthase n=1 Tax=Bugula neritina TaxID=10212 RepID=A0A7J7IT78_BUGNE|nr:hypothetical protein EB796_025088 [Bugula neritina]
MAFRVYTAPPPKGCERLFKTVFSAEAKAFIGELYTAFQSDIEELYRRRIKRRVELDTHNQLPDFLSETKAIRENLEWRVDPIPARLRNRKIDCGDVSPSNRLHFKKALNSEANGIQVDFDDGHCPTWTNQILGYSNIIEFVSGSMPGVPTVPQAPVLMLRPRAWNMVEHHVLVNGEKVPGPVVDFAILMYHASAQLYASGSGPFFYLSKLEGYKEARLWRKIFVWAEHKLGMPVGSIKACVLIENILAAFEMEEILYELRTHSLGLNCGIWDYCASIINKFGTRQEFRLPDRSKYVNMQKHFLESYCKLVVDVCHKRGALATGGMNAKMLPAGNSHVREEITQQVCM